MIKTLITAFVIACGVLAYIWRKLPKKKERLKKKELETQIMQMEEKSKKFGVPVDNLKRDELNAKIKEIESTTFNFDVYDFLIFAAVLLICLYLSGEDKPKDIVVFIINITLYGSGLFWGVATYFRRKIKQDVTQGIATKEQKEMIYKQMVLNNPEYKKLNLMCDLVLPGMVVISGIIAHFITK